MKAWEIKKIGEVCTLKSGTTVNKNLERASGDIPYLKVADMTLPENNPEIFTSSRFLSQESLRESSIFPIGTTIFPKRGGAILTNKKRLTAVSICADLNIMGVVPSKFLLPKFLYFHFLNIDMRKLGSGSSIPQINNYDIEPLIISFPSLLEQKRIVSIVDQAFEGIDRAIANTKKNLTNARELFESYLNAIFTQKGDGWIEKQLQDVCLYITDGKHGDCRNEDNSGYFFLSAKDVKQDRLNYEGARQITKEDFEETHRRTKLEPGDVLITNSGTIGRTAIVPEDERTCKTTFQKSVAILKPIREQINSDFCRYSLMAHLNEIVGISAGTAQKNLLLRDIRAHRFHMPKTVHEQKIIAAKLDEFCRESQRLETIYRQKLAALTELKQSILQKAFTGELTADIANQTTKKAEEAIAA